MHTGLKKIYGIFNTRLWFTAQTMSCPPITIVDLHVQPEGNTYLHAQISWREAFNYNQRMHQQFQLAKCTWI